MDCTDSTTITKYVQNLNRFNNIMGVCVLQKKKKILLWLYYIVLVYNSR